MHTKHILFLLTFSLLFTLPACYEELEGCLDPLAKNYTLAADADCPECCEYPGMELQFKHVFGTGTYALNKWFSTVPGDSFNISQQSIYLSSVSLKTISGETLNNLSLKTYTLNQNTVEVLADFCLVKSTSVVCSAGSARFAGSVNGASFVVGLNDQLTNFDSASVARDAVLTWREPARSDDTYYAMYFKVTCRDSTEKSIFVPLLTPFSLQKSEGYINTPGQTVAFVVSLDYQKLFANINFGDTEAAIIAQMIAGNLSTALTAAP